MVNNRHTVPPNRGASRHTIEKNTFAHRYKRMKKTIEGDLDREEDIDKCTICLCEFEYEEHVRYVELLVMCMFILTCITSQTTSLYALVPCGVR